MNKVIDDAMYQMSGIILLAEVETFDVLGNLAVDCFELDLFVTEEEYNEFLRFYNGFEAVLTSFKSILKGVHFNSSTLLVDSLFWRLFTCGATDASSSSSEYTSLIDPEYEILDLILSILSIA